MTVIRQPDLPKTFAVLEELGRSRPEGLSIERYTPFGEGSMLIATVDWDLLADSHLSSTERAMVHVARGMEILERNGGAPARLGARVLDAGALWGAR